MEPVGFPLGAGCSGDDKISEDEENTLIRNDRSVTHHATVEERLKYLEGLLAAEEQIPKTPSVVSRLSGCSSCKNCVLFIMWSCVVGPLWHMAVTVEHLAENMAPTTTTAPDSLVSPAQTEVVNPTTTMKLRETTVAKNV